jgi:hypothetical protein
MRVTSGGQAGGQPATTGLACDSYFAVSCLEFRTRLLLCLIAMSMDVQFLQQHRYYDAGPAQL